MTTRAEIRAALRLRLEDGDAAPLWDDATLNDAIAAAIRAYGVAFPRQVTTGIAVAAGDSRVPAGVPVDPGRIVRVLDAAGIWVMPWPPEAEPRGARGQAWRWWAGELILAEPAAASAAGIWTIEHLTGREPPATDGAALDVLPGDEEIVLLLAEATALARRATEDAKRGIQSDAAARAESARLTAGSLIHHRKRRIRG